MFIVLLDEKAFIMEQNETTGLLKDMLKEHHCCFGMSFARNGIVPNDVIWEVVKGFDLIYQRARRQAEDSGDVGAPNPSVHRMEPHPGLTYLLEKIER